MGRSLLSGLIKMSNRGKVDHFRHPPFATTNSVDPDEFFKESGIIRLASKSVRSGALYLSLMIFFCAP